MPKMSKEMPVEVFAKKVGIDKKEQEWIIKNDKDQHYHNNTPLKGWLSLSYPVYDGDYYFAFIHKNPRVNAQYNAKANRELKKYIKSSLNADQIFDEMSDYFEMHCKNAGAGDTMTREELWNAIVDARKKNPVREGLGEGVNVLTTYRQMWEDASDIVEVTDKEINAMKQLSKDAEKIKKNYQKIVNMGDKELKDKKYNKEYEDILKMQQSVLSLIGKLQTQKIINKESLEEKLNKQDLKFIDMMYDKKGNLTDVGKAVMNYKPGDNIRKIVQNLNNKK